jgi:hypothetical protein
MKCTRQRPQEVGPDRLRFRCADLQAQHLAPAVGIDADRDDHGDRDDAPTTAHLQIRRVDPQVVRAGTFTPRSAATTRPVQLTFRAFAEIYRTRHVIPKRLALAADYDWSIRPFLDRFDDRPLTEIRTADVQDFVADLQAPSISGPRVPRANTEAYRVPASLDLLNQATAACA